MRKLIVLAVMFIGSITTAQELPTIENVTINDNVFTYKTTRGLNVECKLVYETKQQGENITDEQLRQLLILANNSVIPMLKNTSSFVPLSYLVKYKYNKNGKHKYAVHVLYLGTNSYGAEIETFTQLEFNSKMKETAGSLMLRM